MSRAYLCTSVNGNWAGCASSPVPGNVRLHLYCAFVRVSHKLPVESANSMWANNNWFKAIRCCYGIYMQLKSRFSLIWNGQLFCQAAQGSRGSKFLWHMTNVEPRTHLHAKFYGNKPGHFHYRPGRSWGTESVRIHFFSKKLMFLVVSLKTSSPNRLEAHRILLVVFGWYEDCPVVKSFNWCHLAVHWTCFVQLHWMLQWINL